MSSVEQDNSTLNSSSPELRSESRGSSVSAELLEEYEDILKFAVVEQNHPAPQGRRDFTSETLIERIPIREITMTTVATESLQHPPVPSPPHPTSPPTHPLLLHNPPPPSPPAHSSMTSLRTPTSPPDHSGVPQTTSFTSHHDRESDPELLRLRQKLDEWCSDLRRNVLAEFEQARIRMLENKQKEIEQRLQQQAEATAKVQEELLHHKDMVTSLQTTITQQEEHISNLNTSLEKQRSKVQLQKSFSTWKIQQHDEQREVFTSALARRHYLSHLKAKVWEAWFSVIRQRWKQRVERACQAKAEQVCVQLSTEYDEQLAVSERALNEAREEIHHLKAQQSLFEQNMKQAFMRGVCALNIEAMTVFRSNNGLAPDNQDNEPGSGDNKQEVIGRDPLLNPPPHLRPYNSVPITYRHGNQENMTQTQSAQAPPTSHQQGHVPPSRPTIPTQPTVVASSVQVQTSHARVTHARGQSLVGVAPHKRGRGHKKPAIMVERHTVA